MQSVLSHWALRGTKCATVADLKFLIKSEQKVAPNSFRFASGSAHHAAAPA